MQHDFTGGDPITVADVSNAEGNQVTGTQFTIDIKIEEGECARFDSKLQADSSRQKALSS
jgi:hypothetical protein